MKLNIITGQSGSGKTNKLISSMSHDVDNLIITADPAVYYMEKNMAQNFMPGKCVGSSSFAEFIVEELGTSNKKMISKEAENILIGKIIDENRDKLVDFSNISSENGVVNKIVGFIEECQREDITPEKLIEIAPMMSGTLNGKLKDISVIYSIFMNELERMNYITGEDMKILAARLLAESNSFSYNNILIDTLDDYDYHTLLLITELIKKCEMVTIVFSSTSPKAYDYEICKDSMAAMATLKSLVIDAGCPFEEIPVKRGKDNSNGIKIIEKELFNKDTDTISDADNVILHKASTMYKEIDFVSSKINELLASGKYKLEDIVVTSANIDRYINIIATSFNKNNIKYFYYKNNQLYKTYLYDFINCALETVKNGYTASNLMRLAQFHYMNIAHEDLITFESFFVRFGKNLKIALANGEKYDKANTMKVKNIISLLTKDLDILSNDINNSKIAKDYMSAILKYLNTIEITKKLNAQANSLIANNKIIEGKNILASWNTLINIFNQFNLIYDDTSISTNEFMAIIDKMAKDAIVRNSQQYHNQITLVEMNQAKNRKSKVLFVIGCNEGYFPESVPPQIINDRERMFINNSLNTNLLKSDNILTRKQAAIYTVLTLPSDKLFITWSLNDIDAKPMRYSSLISNVVKTFEQNIVPEKDFYDNDKEAAFIQLLVDISAYKHTGIISNTMEANYRKFSEDTAYSLRLYNAINNATVDRRKINAENPTEAYRENDFFAVTRIEKFNKCPFAHFVEYALKPEIIKIFDESAADKGNYYHIILKEFFDYIINNEIVVNGLTEDKCIELITPIIDKVELEHNENILQSANKYEYEKYQMRRKAEITAWNFVKQMQKGLFDVKKNEYVVGKEIAYDIVLDDGKTVHIVGTIDRLDTGTFVNDNGERATFARIIDYKTGMVKYDEKLQKEGLQLQLPLYLKAISDLYIPAGMYYAHITDPIKDIDDPNYDIEKEFQLSGPTLADRGVIDANDKDLSEAGSGSSVIPVKIKKDNDIASTSNVVESFDEILESSVSLAKETISKIREGETFAKPFRDKDVDSCKYCPYKSLCYYDSTVKNSSRTFTQDMPSKEE